MNGLEMVIRRNPTEVFNRCKKFFALSFLAVGVLWCLNLSRHNDLRLDYMLGGIGAVYIGITGILLFVKFRSTIAVNFFLVMFSFNVGYLLMETGMFFFWVL
jgi:hypothetical protein